MSHAIKTAFEELLVSSYDDSQVNHSKHWQVFFEDLNELVNMLPLIAKASKRLVTCADDQDSCPLPFPETEPAGDLLVWPEENRGMIQIHVTDRKTGEASIASAYPWMADGVTHMAKIEGIYLWPDRLEAHVQARIGDGMSVTFFDPLFVRNRVFYRRGGFYPMVFSGMAYEFRVHDVAAKEGAEIKDTTCRLVQDGAASDEYVFIGIVQDVKTVRFLDAPVFVVRVMIGQMLLPFSEPVNIDVLVTDEALGLSRAPEPQDIVYGRLWLTAYLRKPKKQA